LSREANVEPVSYDFEPSLCHQNTDIENSRSETGARNGRHITENQEKCASETRDRHANSRKYRVYFCGPDMCHRDGTGWLSMQSNANRSPPQNPGYQRKIQGISPISAFKDEIGLELMRKLSGLEPDYCRSSLPRTAPLKRARISVAMSFSLNRSTTPSFPRPSLQTTAPLLGGRDRSHFA
jgi:hypothetical protein